MKPGSADGENEGEALRRSGVPELGQEEFAQSLAVAQLAVKLCELAIGNPINQSNKAELTAEKFVADARALIKKAREHVSVPLPGMGWSGDEAQDFVAGVLAESRVTFVRLCDCGRNKGDRELIVLRDAVTGETIEVDWLMYRGAGGERAFDTMFRSYWEATSRIEDEGEMEECGRRVLASWKKDGVPGNTFLRFARFRREADDRSANLKKSGA